MKFLPTPSETFHRRMNAIEKELLDVTTTELYHTGFEHSSLSNFYRITEKPDFKEKYFSLIRGLDVDSVETVVKILKRQQMINDTISKHLDIYTLEEQKSLKILKKTLSDNILKIADDLYCYKNYLLPINEFEPIIFFDRYGLGNINNIESLKNKDIIDVGGYIGDSILIFSPLTNQPVYSFEPVKKNYELMLKTIELNNIKNAVPENFALGARQETLSIYVNKAGSSFLRPVKNMVKHQETVRVRTLDEYVEKNSLNVGLIKVDIEGFEQEFLKGAQNTIKKQKPILLLSIYHNPGDFFNIKPMLESWDIGYKFKIFKNVDGFILVGALLIAEIR